MAGLQRSTTSFRRQGSSGLVWDDKCLTQLASQKHNQQRTPENQGKLDINQDNDVNPPLPRPISNIERSRSNGGYRTGRVPQAMEPPSPRVSACGFCGAFGKPAKNHRKKAAAGQTRSR